MTSPTEPVHNAPTRRHYYDAGFWRDETIYEVAARNAQARPESTAIRDRFCTLSWAGLVDAADAYSGALAASGLCSGDRVAVWMPDRIEAVIILLACSRNGYVFCPSPHRNHTVADVIQLVERMRAAAFIWQDAFGADGGGQDVPGRIGTQPSIRHFRTLAASDGSFTALLGGSDTAIAPPVRDPDSLTYLAFTSGSTGQPKGVMHSDNTLLLTARVISRDWNIGPDSVVYSMSPFSHNLGFGTMLTAMMGAAELVIHDLPRGHSVLDRLIETRTSYLVGVPTHALDFLEELKTRDSSGLHQGMSFRISGAAAPPHLILELFERGIIVQTGYGMTENNAHQYSMPDDDPDLVAHSCGRTCEGYDLAVFDPANPDVRLTDGETGLLGGRGACLMLGYFDDPAATAQSFNASGWFMTGDLARIDEHGYLRLTGRKKDVIIRGGHNINPTRIEELALRHVAVERAAAIPVPDERLGEKACIAIMPRTGATVSADELADHLGKAGLSRYDMPEYFLHLEEIPLMANGKVEKGHIERWIREGQVTPALIVTGQER
jgi:acyl-CoA synthetase